MSSWKVIEKRQDLATDLAMNVASLGITPDLNVGDIGLMRERVGRRSGAQRMHTQPVDFGLRIRASAHRGQSFKAPNVTVLPGNAATAVGGICRMESKDKGLCV